MTNDRRFGILLSPFEKAEKARVSRGFGWCPVGYGRVNECRKQHYVQKTHHWNPNHPS